MTGFVVGNAVSGSSNNGAQASGTITSDSFMAWYIGQDAWAFVPFSDFQTCANYIPFIWKSLNGPSLLRCITLSTKACVTSNGKDCSK